MKKRDKIDITLLLVCLLMLWIFSPFTGLDILSLNSGGGTLVVVSSGTSTEGGGFFSLISPIPPVNNGGGGGSGGSSGSPSGTLSGGSLGGGLGGGASVEGGITFNITSFDLTMLNNTGMMEYVLISNNGASSATISINQSGLTGITMIEGSASFSLSPGGSRLVGILFMAPKAVGIYKGNIVISGNNIPVSINVVSHLILFNTNVQISNPNSIVTQGGPVNAKISINPIKGLIATNVTLEYSIKEEKSGNVYLTKSEGITVNGPVTITRSLNAGTLPTGNYTLYVNTIYANEVSSSSASFLVEKSRSGRIGYYLLVVLITLGSIALLIALIILIRRIIKKRKFWRGQKAPRTGPQDQWRSAESLRKWFKT